MLEQILLERIGTDGSPLDEGFATLTTRLCHGELDKVPAALMLYVNPGGPSEAGLRRRRKAEAALWSAAPSLGARRTLSAQDPGASTGSLSDGRQP